MNEARALLCARFVRSDNSEGTSIALLSEVVEWRLIGAPDHVGALGVCDDLGPLRPDGVHKRLGDPVLVGIVADAGVVDIGSDGDREIARKRPWCCRPDQQPIACSHPTRAFDDFQPNGDRRIIDVAVVHVRFEVRERGGGTPGVGEDLEVAIDESLVPESLEDPPDRFHEFRIHGLVVVLEVDPSSDSSGDVFPLFGGLIDHDPARFVVAVDAIVGDLARARYPQLLLDFHFDGQTMGIPTEAALDPVSAHGPVARDYVLDDTNQDVPVVRAARSEWWAVVEREAVLFGALLD